MSKVTSEERDASMELARLRAEAEFQDRRSAATDEEPREKYYFLADRAKASYWQTVGDVTGQKVLVVGCAEGGVTPIARRGGQVVGIDISAEAIKRLNNHIRHEGLADRASALVMNAENTEFPSESFDTVCCSGVLHHLDVESAVRSWSGILRPGGRVVMLEPMAWNPGVALYRYLTPESRTQDEHPLTPADVRVLRHFFTDVRIRPFVLTSVVASPLAHFPGLRRLRELALGLLEPLDSLIFRVCPWLRYFAWTAVIECSGPRQALHSGGIRK